MNADNRANPGAGQTFNPVSGGQPEQTRRSPQRSSLRPMSGEMPVSGQQPVSGQVATPRAGGVFAPTSAPAPASRQQPVSGQQPVSAQQPVSGEQPTSGAYPTTGTRSASSPSATTGFVGGAAAGVGNAAATGFDKIKDFAAKAKDDLTSADDIAASQRKGGPRKVRVLVSRIDPWSALKIGFLLSIALGIMLVVAVYVLWGALNSLGVFALANEWVMQLFDDTQELDLLQFFELNKWMSASVLIAVVNVVLFTALATIGAFLYNTISKVVGGFYVTLTDD